MQRDQPNYFQGIPAVTISPQGIFKYILIEVTNRCNIFQSPTYFVRGDTKHQYHVFNFDAFIDELLAHGFNKDQVFYHGLEGYHFNKGGQFFKVKCLGGGKIQHNYQGNKCFIYGQSNSFGPANHSIAKDCIANSLGYSNEQILASH